MRASETLRAPAKLNLTLEVLPKRADGLHGVRSVMVPIDLCDELCVEGHDGFSFDCDDPQLRSDNLVERAVRALDLPTFNARILLRKRIPAGAGMGGGSSDAAAVLLASVRAVFGERPSVDLLQAARALGSDVPFFLVQTAALVEGTGERITALGAVPPWHAIVVKPPVAVNTAAAYNAIDAQPRPTRPRNSSSSLAMGEALQRRDFNRVVQLLANDFQAVVAAQFDPIREALELLRAAGAANAVLTGSGSCVFALAPTMQARDRIVSGLRLPPGFALYTAAFWNGPAWRSAA